MTSEVAPDRLAFTSLDDWQAWQWRQQPALRRKWRELRYRSGGDAAAPNATLWNSSASRPTVLFALDSHSPSHLAAVAEPLRLLISWGVPVGLVGQPPPDLPSGDAASADDLKDVALRAAVSVGNHLGGGAYVKALASRRDAPHLVVQHGALTPLSPPPADGDMVLAWSDTDAQMWIAGRSGVEARAVGSQMLWQASLAHRGESAATEGDATASEIVFLGQLHGAELPRRLTMESVRQLHRETLLIYRPHPAESDLLSSAQHRRWRSQGIKLDTSGQPLAQLRVPVVAQFSTGLLEATASGVPAFGFCAQAPAWVEAFWDRYGIARWGSSSHSRTAVWERPPAQEIAIALGDEL